MSGNHLNKYWGYWKNRESFPLNQIWSKCESEHRWKVNIIREGAEHSSSIPELGISSTHCGKPNFVHPPSYATGSFQPEIQFWWPANQKTSIQMKIQNMQLTSQSQSIHLRFLSTRIAKPQTGEMK